MRELSFINLTIIGTHLRTLQAVRGGEIAYKDINGSEIYGIAGNLRSLLAAVEDFGFSVTNASVAMHDLSYVLLELEKKPNGSFLTTEDADFIRNEVSKFTHTLSAESCTKPVFVLTEKRLEILKLISNIAKLFPEGIYDRLSPISQYDFSEAGKCIAFDRSTAAAFHILRATEEIFRRYYCHHVKKNRVKKLTWGDMLVSLRAKKKFAKSPIINHLQNIKDDFRNPTAHPEMIYDLDDVQDLFSRCVDVVSRMIKEMK